MRRCRRSQTQLSAARWALLLQLLLPVQLLGSAPVAATAHDRSGAAAHSSAHHPERNLATQTAAATQSATETRIHRAAAVDAHDTEGHGGPRRRALANGAAFEGGTGFTTFGAATGTTVSWASRAGGAAAAAAGQAAAAPKPSHCREDLPGCCPKELKRKWPCCKHAAHAKARLLPPQHEFGRLYPPGASRFTRNPWCLQLFALGFTPPAHALPAPAQLPV